MLRKGCQTVADHALTILINLSVDRDVLENLATDEKFLTIILDRVAVSRAIDTTCRHRWRPR
jgi:hypothetical protein